MQNLLPLTLTLQSFQKPLIDRSGALPFASIQLLYVQAVLLTVDAETLIPPPLFHLLLIWHLRSVSFLQLFPFFWPAAIFGRVVPCPINACNVRGGRGAREKCEEVIPAIG